MPRTSRSRVISAEPQRVWNLVGDPGKLPRWWPRVDRVDRPDPATLTKWVRSPRGRAVAMRYHLAASVGGESLCWEQEITGTPFARSVSRSVETIEALPAAGGTKVTLTIRRHLRGTAKMGALLVARGQRKELDEALDRLEQRFEK